MIVAFQEKLISQECVACSITFAVTETVDRQLRQSKRPFQCPNGHDQSYALGEIDSLRDKVAELTGRQMRDAEHIARLTDDATDLARQNAALRGVITKLKGRQAK